MKNITLILALSFTLFSLSAQKEFTQKWGNGIPKIRLILRGIDTLLFEEYRENGSILQSRWNKDSVYFYDRHGIILEKQFFKTAEKYKIVNTNTHSKPDSSIYFYPNGLIMIREYFDSRGIFYQYYYSIEEKLEHFSFKETLNEKLIKTTSFYPDYKRTEKSWHYKDLHIKRDTSFFDTGEVSSIFEIQADIGNIKSITIFDKKGNIIPRENKYEMFKNSLESLSHDSIQEKRQKLFGSIILNIEDFPDTFFLKKQGTFNGLVDVRSNWVLQPQFDTIITYRGTHFKVMVNGKYGIISKSGNWLIPPQYDGVEFTHLPDIFIVEKFQSKDSQNEKSTIPPQYDNDGFPNFKNSTHSKIENRQFGLVKTDGTEVLPIKYNHIEALNWRSPVFLIGTNLNQNNSYEEGCFGLFDAYKGFLTENKYIRCKEGDSYGRPYEHDVFRFKNNSYIILKDTISNKYEIFDHFGKALLTSTFDKIEVQKDDMAVPTAICGWSIEKYPDLNFYPDFGYLIIHNKGKSGVFDLDKKVWSINFNQYDTIRAWLFKHEDENLLYSGNIDHSDVDAELVLLAKKEGKWWILNSKGQPIVNFAFDTIGEVHYECPDNTDSHKCYDKSVFGVKDGKTYFISEKSYPLLSTIEECINIDEKITSFPLHTFDGKKLKIDKNGIVIK